jgi:hypothetical protein
MSDFFEIFKIVKPNLNLFENENVNWKKLMLVLLWSNNDSKVYDYIGSKYETSKDYLDIYCLWKNWFETFLGSWFNMLWYCNVTNDIQESDLDDVWMYISALKTCKYECVNICYLDKNNEVVEFDLFPVCRLDIDYFVDRFEISHTSKEDELKELCIWPWNDELEVEIMMQYIQHIIYWIILQHRINNYSYWSLISLSLLNKVAAN